MSRGPPKIPTAILAQRGSRRAKDRPGEPKVVAKKPPCPRWLSKAARPYWHRVVKDLDTMRVIGNPDGVAIGRYCELLVQWIAAKDHVVKYGPAYSIKNKHGEIVNMKMRPHVRLVVSYEVLLKRHEDSLGLNPAARARLVAIESEPESGGEGKGRFFGPRIVDTG